MATPSALMNNVFQVRQPQSVQSDWGKPQPLAELSPQVTPETSTAARWPGSAALYARDPRAGRFSEIRGPDHAAAWRYRANPAPLPARPTAHRFPHIAVPRR